MMINLLVANTISQYYFYYISNQINAVLVKTSWYYYLIPTLYHGTTVPYQLSKSGQEFTCVLLTDAMSHPTTQAKTEITPEQAPVRMNLTPVSSRWDYYSNK